MPARSSLKGNKPTQVAKRVSDDGVYFEYKFLTEDGRSAVRERFGENVNVMFHHRAARGVRMSHNVRVRCLCHCRDCGTLPAHSVAWLARHARLSRRQRAIVASAGDNPGAPACRCAAIGTDRRTMARWCGGRAAVAGGRRISVGLNGSLSEGGRRRRCRRRAGPPGVACLSRA